MNKVIYIPIEVKLREFQSKLFFISRAIRRGYDCVIGDKIAISRAINFLGPGCYFYKSMNFYDGEHIKSVKNKNNIYIVQDEEAGYALNDNLTMQQFIKMRSSDENVNLIDKFYTWGKFDHNNWVKAFSNSKNKFFMSGSPRIDLWKDAQVKKVFQNEIRNIKKFKNYVLIASSGISSTKELKKQERVDKFVRKNLNENSAEKKNRTKWQLDIFKEMILLTNHLAKKFPDVNFIFRNHPSDSNDKLNKYFNSASKNIIVNNDYDVTPWIHSSSCVIHACSTIGIQTSVMKKNLISFNPKVVRLSHRRFPNKFGILARTIKDTETKLKKILLKKIKKKTTKIINERFEIKKELSSELILNNINRLKIPHSKKKYKNIFKIKIYSIFFYVKDFVFKFLGKIKRLLIIKKNIRQINYSKTYITRKSYHEKNPQILKHEIRSFFKSLLNTKEQKQIELINICPNGFFIRGKR